MPFRSFQDTFDILVDTVHVFNVFIFFLGKSKVLPTRNRRDVAEKPSNTSWSDAGQLGDHEIEVRQSKDVQYSLLIISFDGSFQLFVFGWQGTYGLHHMGNVWHMTTPMTSRSIRDVSFFLQRFALSFFEVERHFVLNVCLCVWLCAIGWQSLSQGNRSMTTGLDTFG